MKKPSVVALTMFRNESWVLGASLRAALQWADAVYAVDHGSTDDSLRIVSDVANEFPGRVAFEHLSAGLNWPEMLIRQSMLDAARKKFNPTHFAIVDADEILSTPSMKLVPEMLRAARPGQTVALPQVAPYWSLDVRRVDGYFGESSQITLLFGDRPDLHWANAADGYCFHHRQPKNSEASPDFALPPWKSGGVIHLQYASRARLAWKALWYKLVETTNFPGRKSADALNQMYDWTLRSESTRLEGLPRSWFPIDPGTIDLAAEPWQATAARAIVSAHGRDVLKGLTTHGLPI